MDDFDTQLRARLIALADAAGRTDGMRPVAVAPVRRARGGSIVPAVGSALAVVVAFALAAAILPHLLAQPGPAATAPSSPTVPPALNHYTVGRLTFDYPSQWRLISAGVDEHYIEYGPVIGIGDWQIPCATILPSGGSGGGESCRPAVWNVPPGGVVVQFTSSAAPFATPTPPPDAVGLADGIRATEVETATSSVWQLYVPRSVASPDLTIEPSIIAVEARYAAPNIELARLQVRALVESIRIRQSSSAASPSPSPSASPQPSAGIGETQAIELAREHTAPTVTTFVSAIAGRLGNLRVVYPGEGLSPDRLAWAVTFSGTVTIVPPSIVPGAQNSPEPPRSGTLTIYLDYGTGAFLGSAGSFPQP